MKYLLYKLGIPVMTIIVAMTVLLFCIIAVWIIPFYRMFRMTVKRR